MRKKYPYLLIYHKKENVYESFLAKNLRILHILRNFAHEFNGMFIKTCR